MDPPEQDRVEAKQPNAKDLLENCTIKATLKPVVYRTKKHQQSPRVSSSLISFPTLPSVVQCNVKSYHHPAIQ